METTPKNAKFVTKKDCVPLIELNATTTDKGRVYNTPNGDYPSITTILSILSKDSIDKWKKRVGEGKAAYVSKVASERGTELHRLVECYTLGLPVSSTDYTALSLFEQIKKVVDKSLHEIYYQECALYSDTIKLAGRCDLIGIWDGQLSIIDYKTSKRLKTEDDIEAYFIQACFYSIALEELTGYKAKQLVIVIGNDSENAASVFVKQRKDYVKRLVEVRKMFGD